MGCTLHRSHEHVASWLVAGGRVIGFGAGCATKDDASRGGTQGGRVRRPPRRPAVVRAARHRGQRGPARHLRRHDRLHPSEAKTKLEELELQLTDAMNQWNALLAGNPLWHFKGRIAPNYMMQSTECTQTIYTGFSVNLWKDVARFRPTTARRTSSPIRAARRPRTRIAASSISDPGNAPARSRRSTGSRPSTSTVTCSASVTRTRPPASTSGRDSSRRPS